MPGKQVEATKYFREFCTGTHKFIRTLERMFHVKHFCNRNA